ncbi:hypothetical protein 4L372X_042 [Aeromonas phage 4_L372X]|nr:hypothetical protein 4L372X_042 [Aeromonas phage 4_L372X]
MNIEKWKSMSGLEQTMFLLDNCQVNGKGGKRMVIGGSGVNDATYCTQPAIDGKQVMCPAYKAWKNMFKRVYSAKFHASRPTYSDVKVCDEWRSFSNFRSWWLENQVDGWHIDKDILSDDGVYSPEACIFVPAWLNSFTLDSGSARGVYQIGVCFHKQSGRFEAKCSNPMTKKREHLGLFDTPEAAHLAWRTRKLELALELKPKMDSIDQRIYDRVVEIIMKAR